MIEKVSKRVELFWQQFPRVVCTETVTQSKLNLKGKLLLRKVSVNDYLVALKMDGDRLRIEESRTPKNKVEKAPTVPLLISKGFSTLLLIFHPYFQPDFKFSAMPDERVQGRLLHRIAFTHIPGMPSPSVLHVGATNYPIEWKGIAWIDPTSWSIVKIQTSLENSMKSIGLRSLESEVVYRPVWYQDSNVTYWLPDTAKVQVRTLRQHWVNVHRFTNYRKFSVDIKLEVDMPH